MNEVSFLSIKLGPTMKGTT
uniref:Uncharacterized protein n=1 Tax=Arundo donax TaxID=35708 RepID=A0A0A8Z2X9_ARUDO